MTVKVLPAVPEDKRDIVRLFNQEKEMWPWGGGVIWWRYWDKPGRTERWDKAVLGDKVVGFCHWAMRADNTRTLYDIIVDKEARGKGAGRALVAAMGTPIHLKTDATAESNGFYTKLGFTRIGEKPTRNGDKMTVEYFLERQPAMLDISKPWIMTFTGRTVNPLNLHPEDVDIQDIAHHLATFNRFCGALGKPVSVAQHCVHVARLLRGTPYELAGLLHDGAEAYLGDVTKWLKRELPRFEEAELNAQASIYEAFDIPVDWASEMPKEIEQADRLMVRYEAEQGFGKAWEAVCAGPFGERYPLCTTEEKAQIGEWVPWPWRVAEENFLRAYRSILRANR